MSHQNTHDLENLSRNTTTENTNPDISDKSTQQHNITCSLTPWIGNTLPPEKPSNTLRITFQNLNSIGTNHTAQNMTTIISEQIAIESDILCMTEHCVNVHHKDIHYQIQSSLRKAINEKVNLQITSSNTQTESPYLPGGTAIAITGNSVGRLEQTNRGGDDMGRWTYLTLKRKYQPPITIFSVYQVNIRPTNEIGITAWHQQRIALNKLGKSHLHPRQAFIQDLTNKVKQLQSMNHDIILGGDFNETTEKSRSGLLKLMIDTGLLDPWTHRFPTHPTFNTYRRGSQRIDTILCSPAVLPMIRTMSYSPFNWFINSDHRAMILDLSSIIMFQEPDDTTQLSVQQRAI